MASIGRCRDTTRKTPLLTCRAMTDIFDPEKRSEIMSRIRDRDTKPEMIVRRIAARTRGACRAIGQRGFPAAEAGCYPARKTVHVGIENGTVRGSGPEPFGRRFAGRGVVGCEGGSGYSVVSTQQWRRSVREREEGSGQALSGRGDEQGEVARRVGIGRRTLYNWIGDGLLEGLLGGQKGEYGPRRPRASKLDPYKGIIEARLAAYPRLSAVRLFEEVRAAGYPGGYDQVRRHVREVRPREPAEPPVRFETPPGERPGDVEPLFGIGQRDGVVFAPLVVLDQHEKLAEDARQVAPADLVDDEDVGDLGVGPRAFAEAVEDSGLEGKPAVVGGAKPLHEVLVGVGLVELDHLDGAVVPVADQAPGDPAGDEGLPGAGRALEDEVLAALERGEEAVEVGGGDEEVLVGVGGGVGGGRVGSVRFCRRLAN